MANTTAARASAVIAGVAHEGHRTRGRRHLVERSSASAHHHHLGALGPEPRRRGGTDARATTADQRDLARELHRDGDQSPAEGGEHRVLDPVGQRLVTVGGHRVPVVQRAVHVAHPHVLGQFVQHLDAVAIGIRHVHAVRHAVVAALTELDALLAQHLEPCQELLSRGVADGDVVDADLVVEHVPLGVGRRERRRVGRLDEREVVVSVGRSAVEAEVHRDACGPYGGLRVERAALLEPEGLGVEPVGRLDVANHQRDVLERRTRLRYLCHDHSLHHRCFERHRSTP